MGEPDMLGMDRNQALRQMVEDLEQLLARSQQLIATPRPRLDNEAQPSGCPPVQS
jgi:hypothetical protein